MSAALPFTVILTCHNAGSRLEPALESIWGQSSPPSQLIAVDLGSDDGTVSRLEACRARLAQLILAPGATRYEALNQAIAFATGEWVLVLGGRDRLVGDAVLSETLNWMRKTEAGVVAGESAADDGRIQKLHSHVNAAAQDFAPRSATFYRHSLFSENGGFDASLRWMGEYDFHVRLWKGRVRFKPIPLRIAARAADSEDFGWSACREEIAVRHRYFSTARCAWWDAVSVLRCARASVRTRRQRAN